MSTWSTTYSIRIPLVLLAIVEGVSVILSVYLATNVSFDAGSIAFGNTGSVLIEGIVVAAMVSVSFIAMGLYDFHQRASFKEIVARIVVSILVATMGLAVLYFVFPGISLPSTVVTVAICLAFFFILLVRIYFFRNVDTNIFRRRTMIYGAGSRAAAINSLRRRADRRGFQVVGFLTIEGETSAVADGAIQSNGKSLIDLSREFEIDEIVIALDERRGNLPIRELLACKLAGINVIDIVEFLERESEKIRVDLVNPAGLIFSSGFRASRFRKVSKRALDLILSVVVLSVAWPIMILSAVAIKIEEGFLAPVFYRQVRVGQYGELFRILKFRSMRVDAESHTGAVWAEKNDTRITKVGSFLRKTRLDELPQLLNVVLGQMSVVGPRPERPEFVEQLANLIPFYAERHTVKPGITGWAQLRYPYGSSSEDSAEKLQFDLYYVKNHGVLLDIFILLQTVEVVFWGKGAR